MSQRTKFIFSAISILSPGIAIADGIEKIKGTVSSLYDLIGGTLPKLFFALALVYFFYGLGSYVMGVDDKKKAEAKTTIIYGIIVLFVMSSVWGLVNILQDATGTRGGGINIPTLQ